MTRKFGAQHIKNGYAAMGNALQRPRHKGMNKKRTVAEAIAAERAASARALKMGGGKKK